MKKEIQNKYDNLLSYLGKLDNIAVAFSGGVDSAFLLHAAKEAMGKKVLALTINSPYIPDWEIAEAMEITASKGIEHQVVDVPVPEQIKNNPEDRCYLCKSFLFTLLKEFAKQRGFSNLADGTNYDDTKDHRPGMKALEELHVLSPLLENRFTKNDIREASREMGLYTWEKPAYACLLTRIPYNSSIEVEMLRRIEKAETFLIGLGIRSVRVRTHGDLARIETEQRYIEKIFNEGHMDNISKQLRRYGFKYVTLDLERYRTGGIGEIMKEHKNDRKK
jgi:pyridinium-3,5-biscarboxylic acid mononucleotide sulfurtransferase